VGIYWKTKSAKGDATEKNHAGWIKLSGLNFSSSRAVTTRTGRVADRHATTGRLGEIHLAKDMDTASMDLFMSTCLGEGEDMEIHVTRAGSRQDKSEVVYLKYVLENALVTGYAFNSSGANPSENLTVNYTKVTMTHTPPDAALKGTGGNNACFDQVTGAAEGA
jgi:type VI secretion system Hcp family effector